MNTIYLNVMLIFKILTIFCPPRGINNNLLKVNGALIIAQTDLNVNHWNHSNVL